MPRKSLMGVALLTVFVGCRDGPTTVEMPVEPESPVQVTSSAQPGVLLTIQQMLDDPLVLEIVEALGDRTVASGFDGLRDELDRQTVQGDVLEMQRALMTTRDFVAGDSAGADIVLRDVLKLVLDDAGMMLVGDVDVTQPKEGDRLKHGERVKH